MRPWSAAVARPAWRALQPAALLQSNLRLPWGASSWSQLLVRTYGLRNPLYRVRGRRRFWQPLQGLLAMHRPHKRISLAAAAADQVLLMRIGCKVWEAMCGYILLLNLAPGPCSCTGYRPCGAMSTYPRLTGSWAIFRVLGGARVHRNFRSTANPAHPGGFAGLRPYPEKSWSPKTCPLNRGN